MKKSIIIASIIFTPITFASEGLDYFNASFQRGTYAEDGIADLNPSSVRFSAGKYVAKNIAIEGQFALGLTDDTLVSEGINVDLKLKNAISLFAKGEVPLADNVKAYGLIGLTKGSLEASGSADGFTYTVSESDSGLSYGFGAAITVSEKTDLTVDYTSYLDEDAYEYSALSFGASVKF